MESYLKVWTDRHVSASLVSTLGRTTDRIAEAMAEELLRDPVFREEMQTLIRAAFKHALQAMAEPTDTPNG
jgi:hypothetical protein